MAFDLNEVTAGLAGTEFAGRLVHLPSVGSTNTLALEAAQAGARGGVWVADEQTTGRGRGAHRWHSIAGDGLYVSILVAPALTLERSLWISLATGLASRQAIRHVAGLDADIRWPNDLLLGGKKCGGILVETSITPATSGSLESTLRYAVIGIGINLNHESFPEEISQLATSLRRESGRTVRRETFLVRLLQALEKELRRLARPGGKDLLERFSAASSWVHGKRVHVDESGGYAGVTAGLDVRGFLLVDCEDGVRRTVLSGGVREQH
ncbi:biotin--[acetyl-CoA-carboxylase] ligase [Edaphobacter modestus]|uniref:BirA family biotin operon repressor/biotin-[acetyl-CoA-carboxylase] ligase n=1 Tax=Edaphobacter modestus TaxID=388466 RepID=A0A4Q7YVF5_9BACT|nr:biotin--[acetyl-CoA-carboxylase] ligase [Edaphobacter modestus]RZU40979.1 BirA family biotin operon repressor/biotin-[acetyl-CoA-carboxylase] ligase [Edaphobacter modestus]